MEVPPQYNMHDLDNPITHDRCFIPLYCNEHDVYMYARQINRKYASNHMHGVAVASLVDLVGSAVFFAGGSPTTGVSLEITVSYLNAARANEEIEIEARVLGIGGTTGCMTVEVRWKRTGEVIAHGRHTKYLAISSKL